MEEKEYKNRALSKLKTHVGFFFYRYIDAKNNINNFSIQYSSEREKLSDGIWIEAIKPVV